MRLTPSFLLAAAAAALAAGPAHAQFTWTGTASGNWSAASNWAGGLPAPGPATSITLAGTNNVVTTQDLAAAFQLNSLSMNAAAAGNFVVNPSNGSSLLFAGTNPAVTYTGGGSTITSFLTVNTALDFGGSAATLAVNGPSGTGTFYELVVGGRLSGTGTITRTNSGAAPTDLVLRGRNGAFSGAFDNGGGGGGITVLGAHNVFGPGAAVNTGSTALGGVNLTVSGASTQGGALSTASAFSQRWGSVAGAGQVVLSGAATGGATLLAGSNGSDTTLAGALSAPATTGAAPHFGKVGTGTLTLTGASTGFAGDVSVRDGGVVLSGPGGALSSPGTGLSVYAGATLRANNSVNINENRLPGTGGGLSDRPISLSGGTLWLTGSATSDTSEVASGLRLLSGQSTVLVDGVTAAVAHRFNFASPAPGGGGLAVQGGTASVFFRSTNLGQFGSTSENTGGVAFTGGGGQPPLVGGGGLAGMTSVSIIPFAFGTGATSASTVTTPESFVTYSVANNSVRSLTNAEYAAAFGSATDNVSLSAVTTLSAAATANAVRLTPGGSVNLGGNTLTVTSGALLNNGGGNITGTGTLSTGIAAPVTAYVTTNGAMTISASINAANLSKNGAGNLTLGGNVTLSAAAGNGVVAVNAGSLTVGAGVAVANARTYQVSRDATLIVSANPLALGAGQTLTGAGGVQGNVTLNAGATITPSALGGPQADLASPAGLFVSPSGGGSLALNGGSNYVWYVSSALTDGDNTAAPTGDTLNAFKSQYTAGLLTVGADLDLTGASSSNRINLRITSLGLSNGAGAVYDLDKFTDTRRWVIAETIEGGQIVGFSPDKFNLDVTNFANLQGGDPNTFSLSVVDNRALVLTFTPVPEPGVVLAVAAGALGLAVAVRRRRAAVA